MSELGHSSRFDHEMTTSSARSPRERTFSGRASKSQRGLTSGSRCRCRFTNPSVEGCWTDAAAQAAVIAAHRHLFDQLPPPLQRQPARLENRKTKVGSRPMATYDLPPQHERGPLPLNYLHGAATPAASDDDRRPPAPFVKRSAAHGLPRLAPPHDRREAYVQRPCRAAKPVDVVEAKVLCGRFGHEWKQRACRFQGYLPSNHGSLPVRHRS